MGSGNTRPLVFLATCLGFAETALGTLAGFTDADPTMVAIFAMVCLGMVSLALVAMYFREPAFLTFTGERALSLRMIQEARQTLSPELMNAFLGNLMERDLSQGQTAKIAGSLQVATEEAAEVDSEFDILTGSSG